MALDSTIHRDRCLDMSSASICGLVKLDDRYNRGYTPMMKTAISIPDQLFTEAEKTAKRLGISRSELYASAVREYVKSHMAEEITEKLNLVYSAEESSLDPKLGALQSRSLDSEDW